MGISQLLVVTALALVSGPVLACSCILPGTPAQEFHKNTHVFVGVVTSVQLVEPPPPVRLNWLESLIEDIRSIVTGRKARSTPARSHPFSLVAVSVQERFKGARGSELILKEAPDSAGCGYAFERGKTYVIYAQPHQGALVSGICSLTGPVTDPRTGISQLRAGI